MPLRGGRLLSECPVQRLLAGGALGPQNSQEQNKGELPSESVSSKIVPLSTAPAAVHTLSTELLLVAPNSSIWALVDMAIVEVEVLLPGGPVQGPRVPQPQIVTIRKPCQYKIWLSYETTCKLTSNNRLVSFTRLSPLTPPSSVMISPRVFRS